MNIKETIECQDYISNTTFTMKHAVVLCPTLCWAHSTVPGYGLHMSPMYQTPSGHDPIPQTAPGITFLMRSSTGITLPTVPSLQTLVPTTWHAPDTDPDGLYSLPEPSGPCVLPSSYLYIDPRHISTHVSRPPAPDRPPDSSG